MRNMAQTSMFIRFLSQNLTALTVNSLDPHCQKVAECAFSYQMNTAPKMQHVLILSCLTIHKCCFVLLHVSGPQGLVYH